jgi:hypothetical protein
MEDPQHARLSPASALSRRHNLLVQPTDNTAGRKTSGINPVKHQTHYASFVNLNSEVTGFAVDSIHPPVPVPICSIRAEVQLPVLDFVAAPAACAIDDQLALEFCEAPEDVHHKVGHRSCFRRQFTKDYTYILFFEVALDDAKVCNIAG